MEDQLIALFTQQPFVFVFLACLLVFIVICIIFLAFLSAFIVVRYFARSQGNFRLFRVILNFTVFITAISLLYEQNFFLVLILAISIALILPPGSKTTDLRAGFSPNKPLGKIEEDIARFIGAVILSLLVTLVFSRSTPLRIIELIIGIELAIPPVFSSIAWLFAFTLMVIAATVVSTKRIQEGDEALVERLGRYHRKLKPGLNFGIIPFVDEVVVIASTKEQILDIDPKEGSSEATTTDKVRVAVDAVVFWRIFELEKAHYAIEDVEEGIKNLVITVLRSELGQISLQETSSGRDRIIRSLLTILDEATAPWGIVITRVELLDIQPLYFVQQKLVANSITNQDFSRTDVITLTLINEIEEMQKQGSLKNDEESERFIDSNVLDGLKNLSSVYKENLEKRNYTKVVEIADSAYKTCQSMLSAIDREKNRNLYLKLASLSSYWELNRNLYKELVEEN